MFTIQFCKSIFSSDIRIRYKKFISFVFKVSFHDCKTLLIIFHKRILIGIFLCLKLFSLFLKYVLEWFLEYDGNLGCKFNCFSGEDAEYSK